MRAALIAQINLARSWLDERLLRTSDTGSGNPAYWTLNLGSLKALSDLEHAIAHITRLALSLGPPWCDYILTPTTILRLLPLRRRGSRAAVRTMGNCFGKPASPPSGDNFSTPGRVLHSTGAAQQTSIPASHTASRSQGRTLGSSAADSSGDSPKAAAARAAAVRTATRLGPPLPRSGPMVTTAWM